MKTANAQKTHPNLRSRRFDTKIASANGMEKYAVAMTPSETTWSQINSGSHSKQMPWGEKIEESRRRSKKAHMIPPCRLQRIPCIGKAAQPNCEPHSPLEAVMGSKRWDGKSRYVALS